MDGMRPVDHVDEPPEPDAGFWFNPRGWRGWILSVVFAALLVISAVVPGGPVVNLISGLLIIVVVFVVNDILKRTMRR